MSQQRDLDHGALTALLSRPRAEGAPVVSLYFTTNGERADARAIALRGLRKSGEDAIAHDATLADDERRRASELLAHAHGALSSAWNGTSEHGTLVAFASKDGTELFRVPVALADRVAVGPAPLLEPLSSVLEQNERFVVVIVDHERARICESFLGQVRQVDLVEDPVVRKVASAGTNGRDQSRLNHHRDDVLQRHLEHVADRLFALFKSSPFERLVLAGLPESVGKLERSLHSYLAERVVARERWDHTATLDDIRQRLIPIEARVATEREAKLVEVVNARQADGLATRGLAATSRALADGKVAALILEQGVTVAGRSCAACRTVTPVADETACPTCGAGTSPVADVPQALTEAARASGAKVHTIAHARALPGGDGIAALLRFA